MIRVAIIGTGPAGHAAAEALVRLGLRPDVFDIGAEPEPDVEALRIGLRDAGLLSEDLPRLREQAMLVNGGNTGGVPRKLYFGSAFPYADSDPALAVQSVGPVPSRGLGGYSRIWGAAILPPNPDDLADWPPSCRPDADQFDQILRALPVVGAPGRASAPHGVQMADFLRDIAKARAGGRIPVGADLGPAWLAVAADPSPPDHGLGCNACGLCLSGCPRGAILETASRIQRMHDAGLIRLRSGSHVTALEETGQATNVRGIDLRTGERIDEPQDLVLLGAGAIGSARIVLRSVPGLGNRIDLLDSQKILTPVLRLKAPSGALDGTGLTLAGVFLDLRPNAPGDRWSHMQITAINPMVLQHLGIGPDPDRGAMRRRILAPLLARLMVGWAGLHSDLSGRIALTLGDDGSDGGILRIATRRNPASRQAAQAVMGRFAAALRPAGAIAPPFAWRLVEPGAGNHIGGAFPMTGAKTPAFTQSDALARPAGFRRVHVIDAAAFPSLPATTITLLIMAHAARIVREVFR